MEFFVADLANESEYREVLRAWGETSHRQPQAHPAYARAFAPVDSTSVRCAVGQWPSGMVLLPFAVREVPTADVTASVFDAITPYGYGGGYVSGNVVAAEFWRAVREWAQERGIISILIRRDVVGQGILPIEGSSLSTLDNVVVDLRGSIEDIWLAYAGRVRTDIRRATKEGVTIRIDESCELLPEFHRLYIDTMVDKQANKDYHFPLTDLQTMVDAMPGSVCLFHAFCGDELVASEMQLVGTRSAYYFLSGANQRAKSSRANPFMKHRVIEWLKERGVHDYVLGGGMTRGDSLFRYKKGFSPNGVRPFMLDYIDFDPVRTGDMVRNRQILEPNWTPSADFFPAYRAPSE